MDNSEQICLGGGAGGWNLAQGGWGSWGGPCVSTRTPEINLFAKHATHILHPPRDSRGIPGLGGLEGAGSSTPGDATGVMNLAVMGGRKGNTAHPCQHPGDSLTKKPFFCVPGSESCSHTREETSRATQKNGEWAFSLPQPPWQGTGHFEGTAAPQRAP